MAKKPVKNPTKKQKFMTAVEKSGKVKGLALDVLHYLAAQPAGSTPSQIAEALGSKRSSISKRLSDLADWQLVVPGSVVVCPVSGRSATKWKASGRLDVEHIAEVKAEKNDRAKTTSFFSDFSKEEKTAVVELLGFDPEAMRAVCVVGDNTAVIQLLKYNQHITEGLAFRLAHFCEPDSLVHIYLALNTNIPAHVAIYLAHRNAPNSSVHRSLSHNPCIGPLAAIYIGHTSPECHIPLVSNPSTTPELMEYLAESNDPGGTVHNAIAQEISSATASYLAEVNSPNSSVHARLALNPSLDEDTARALFNASEVGSDIHLRLSANPNIGKHLGVVEQLYLAHKPGSTVYENLLANPSVPPALAETIEKTVLPTIPDEAPLVYRIREELLTEMNEANSKEVLAAVAASWKEVDAIEAKINAAWAEVDGINAKLKVAGNRPWYWNFFGSKSKAVKNEEYIANLMAIKHDIITTIIALGGEV